MAYSDVVALEKYLKEIDSANVPEENKVLVKRYVKEDKVKGIKDSTLRGKAYGLLRLALMFPGKKFSEMCKDDVVDFLHDVKPRSKSNYKDKARKDYSGSTRVGYRICVKSFFKWLSGGKDYPENVAWIYAGGNTSKHIDEQDLLTEEDVLALVQKASNTRDAAFIFSLYETGCRISEWLNVKYSDILIDGRVATVAVDGKTGPRKVYLIKSLPLFLDWLNVHPHKDKSDFSVWVSLETNTFGHQMLPCSVRKNLNIVKKRAGLRKPVNPHAFRHARATDCAKRGYQEMLMRKMFGWSKDSNMPGFYIHLVSKDVENKLLSDAGLVQSYSQTEKVLNLVCCPRCGKSHSAGTKFCTCGFVLDAVEAMQVDIGKETKALQLTQTILKDMKSLEEKGLDFEKFSEFLSVWVKSNQK